MTAVLNNPGAFYSNAVYIEECRRLGIPIDFIKRTRADQKETEHLIQCGAFGSIHPSEPLLLMKTMSYFESGCSKAKAEYMTQGLIQEPYSKQQRIVAELQLLGFSVTAHPLSLYEKIIPWNQMVSSLEIDACKDKKVNFLQVGM